MATRRLTQQQRKRHQEAADWVLRHRDSELDPDAVRAFHQWLDCDPDNRRAYDAAQMLLGDARSAISSDPDLNDMDLKPTSRAKPVVQFLLALFVVGSLFVYFDGPMRLQADVVAGISELPVIELKDGSTVQLNASSAIALDYADNARAVRLLRGQALFNVAPDPSRPFSVEAGNTRVTALGTAFDIRRGKTETEVTVTQHAVSVDIENAGQAIRLDEGQQIDIGSDGDHGSIVDVDANAVLGWRRGVLVMDNAPLSLVAEELERRIRGRIVFAGAGLSDRRVSGTIAIADTSAALDFLGQALGVKSTRLGPLIILRD
ncbi:FecR family protein [Hoeflea sp. CAU 1731]